MLVLLNNLSNLMQELVTRKSISICQISKGVPQNIQIFKVHDRSTYLSIMLIHHLIQSDESGGQQGGESGRDEEGEKDRGRREK